jgi:hypothetical protein
LEFEFMRDVHLVVVILVQFYLVNIEWKCSLTPYVEETGILKAFSGATISSMSLVEFSLNVSGLQP